jgi:threonine/homoserine/homoserine lactone efflux protein
MLSTEFLITALIVILVPGAGVIFTISTGLFFGARASAMASLGSTAGIIPHLLAAVLGLAALLHVSAVAFQVVKIIGVAYLLYMAWSMWKNSGSFEIENQNGKHGAWDIALKGFLINILNPKLSIFFLAFLPQFVPLSAKTPGVNMLVLGAAFMLMTFIVFCIYGLCANSMRIYVLHSPKLIKIIQRTFAATFALLGAKLAFAER